MVSFLCIEPDDVIIFCAFASQMFLKIYIRNPLEYHSYVYIYVKHSQYSQRTSGTVVSCDVTFCSGITQDDGPNSTVSGLMRRLLIQLTFQMDLWVQLKIIVVIHRTTTELSRGVTRPIRTSAGNIVPSHSAQVRHVTSHSAQVRHVTSWSRCVCV